MLMRTLDLRDCIGGADTTDLSAQSAGVRFPTNRDLVQKPSSPSGYHRRRTGGDDARDQLLDGACRRKVKVPLAVTLFWREDQSVGKELLNDL